MIDEVLAFWFGTPATTAEEFGKKIKRWYMGGPALDAEIRESFGPLVERGLAGELDDWAQTIRGRLALVLVLDQFPRSVYRNDPRSYAGDAKAQALALEALDRGLAKDLDVEQRNFLVMPLLHAENLALQERSVIELQAVSDAALSLWETGGRMPTPRSFSRLLAALAQRGASPSQLLELKHIWLIQYTARRLRRRARRRLALGKISTT